MTVLRPHKNSATYDRWNFTHQTQLTVAAAETFRKRSIGLNPRFPGSLYAAGDQQGKRFHLAKRTVEQHSHRCGMQPPFVTIFCITVKLGYNHTQHTNFLKTPSTFYVNIQFELHREHCLILVERPSVNVV